ncbi:MAG: hypothetical protein F4025_02960 [Synechococcus sp. SB0669_bin_7]|nr:hypothetical protein [Synechococcus sp. SB0675_bin_7]MYK85378.1 hypothetical protein [Synechococcus sp. SB0669_bin_7]
MGNPLTHLFTDCIPLLKLLEGFKDDPDPAAGESRESSPVSTFQSATGAAHGLSRSRSRARISDSSSRTVDWIVIVYRQTEHGEKPGLDWGRYTPPAAGAEADPHMMGPS